MADAFDTLDDINATTAAVMGNQSLVDVLAPSQGAIDSCITDLVIALAGASSVAGPGQESATSNYILDLLVSPFEEAGSALTELFAPAPGELDNSDGYAGLVSQLAKQLATAAFNPFQAMAAAQLNVLEVGGQGMVDALFAGPDGKSSVVAEISDRTKFVLRQLLMDPSNDAVNLLGLVFFAVDEALPAIQNELVYCRKLRQIANQLGEEASNLPPSFSPKMPNLATADLLCQAEGHLKIVQSDLRQNRTWNAGEFGAATDNVCEAKSVIFNGNLPESFLAQLKNLYGLNDLQLGALRKFNFLPRATYRLRTIELLFWDNALQKADPAVQQFHANLIELLDVINSLSGLHLADIFEQIVEIIRRQIRVVRAQLEANGAGFKLDVDWHAMGVPSTENGVRDQRQPLVSEQMRQGRLPPSSAVTTATDGGTDVGAYIGSQASAYATLSALCFVMGRVQTMQAKIQRLLDLNSSLMGTLRSFVAMYGGADCGDTTGAAKIDLAVKALIRASEDRLSGRSRDNIVVQQSQKALLAAIDGHQAWLTCIRSRLFGGREDLLRIVNGVLAVATAVKNITALARTSAALYEKLASLGIGKDLTGQDKETNVLDALVAALQCFVLQCNNPDLTSLVKYAIGYLGADASRSKAKLLRISALDELPRYAKKVGNNRRIAALLRLIRALQRLTSPSITELCNIPAALKYAPPKISKGTGQPPQDTALRAKKEREARTAAASSNQGLSTSLK